MTVRFLSGNKKGPYACGKIMAANGLRNFATLLRNFKGNKNSIFQKKIIKTRCSISSFSILLTANRKHEVLVLHVTYISPATNTDILYTQLCKVDRSNKQTKNSNLILGGRLFILTKK